MASDVRDRMVQGAAILLAKHGVQATSFSAVLAYTDAPRGSVYHHFPGGKDELIAAAVEAAGANAVAVLDTLDGEAPTTVIDGFMAMWRSVLTRSALTAGCSVLAVTVSAESEDHVDAAGRVFRSWRARLAELLERGGLSSGAASDLAVTAVAAAEGAVVMARAERDMTAFEAAHRQLRRAAEVAERA